MNSNACDVGCAQDQGNRTLQEDYFSLPPQEDELFESHGGKLFLLSDGMGGHENGALASVLGVRLMRSAYLEKPPDQSIPDALYRSVLSANTAIAREGDSAGDRPMGATLVGAVLFGHYLYWVSVGDSFLCLYRNGRLEILNELHVLEEKLKARVRRGELTQGELENNPQREALTSFMGMRELHEVDCPAHPVKVVPGDRILLASDGLLKFLPERKIGEILGRPGTSQHACEALVAETKALHLSGQDNISVVLVDICDGCHAATGDTWTPGACALEEGRTESPVRGKALLPLLLLLLFLFGYWVGQRIPQPESVPALIKGSLQSSSASVGTLAVPDDQAPWSNAPNELAMPDEVFPHGPENRRGPSR